MNDKNINFPVDLRDIMKIINKIILINYSLYQK